LPQWSRFPGDYETGHLENARLPLCFTNLKTVLGLDEIIRFIKKQGMPG
jgi:Ni2+-binding GTPase involved in maturation of urease and hydrogenase